MPTRTEAIKAFLTAKTYPDLASLYNHGMEVQVNVARDGGELIKGEYRGKDWQGWTDGLQTWKNIRIPWNAKTEPEYTDSELKFDLAAHVEGIGMTGWDWKNRVSRWVAFDYDAITGHSDKHKKKLSDDELREIESRIKDVDWVTLRLSTSGKGRHLYVFVDEIETENHTVHAALARSILGMLSGITGYDFSGKADVSGSNMWVWHRKMIGTDGLKIIKGGDILRQIPVNWRDHIKVVSGRAKRTLPTFVPEEMEDVFDELTGQNSIVKLDKHHLRLMDYIRDKDYSSYWDADRRMLITHTYYLAEAHRDLDLRGPFSTLATGSESPNDRNVFCFPVRGGAWAVRRYSQGVAETETWTQDSKGYTRCFLNKEPDFDTACRAAGGMLNAKGGYVFTETELALQAALMLGVSIDAAPYVMTRKCVFSKSKDDKLVVTIEKNDQDAHDKMRGWHVEKRMWQKVVPVNLTPAPTETEVHNSDNLLRHLVKGGKGIGWVVRTIEDKWIEEKLENVKPTLATMGLNPKEAMAVLGACVVKPWEVVNQPFQPEYLEGRVWNRNAAQLAFLPNLADDRSYPTWDKILKHVGSGLDKAIAENQWCKNNMIFSGAEYLKYWVASIIQQPMEQLPYLFLYSREQSTGKTIFHEALKMLFTVGYSLAKLALTSAQAFNAEIENAVLCVVEEEDLSKKAVTAYNRIKDWITAKDILIHPKGLSPITVPNTTHWIQTANDVNYCPNFPGDKRITMIQVPDLDPAVKIPKSKMLDLLRKEAPDFLGELVSLEMPIPSDRLAMEPIDTEEKLVAQEANMSAIDLFVKENCFYVPGSRILMSEFKKRFHESIGQIEASQWSPIKIGRSIPHPFDKGHGEGNQITIINMSWDENTPPKRKLKIVDKKVVEE